MKWSLESPHFIRWCMHSVPHLGPLEGGGTGNKSLVNSLIHCILIQVCMFQGRDIRTNKQTNKQKQTCTKLPLNMQKSSRRHQRKEKMKTKVYAGWGSWGGMGGRASRRRKKREKKDRQDNVVLSLQCSPSTWNGLRLLIQLVNTPLLSVNLHNISDGKLFVSRQAELITPIHTYTYTYTYMYYINLPCPPNICHILLHI